MLSNLLGTKKQDEVTTRRRYTRRSKDRCVTMINDNMFPVIDWSLGGVQIACDEKRFGLGDKAEVALKFQLRDDIIDVPHQAHVVRKNRGRVAFEFEPLNKETRDLFQLVVDDFMANEFIDSQTV